jgi:hypothetical protein
MNVVAATSVAVERNKPRNKTLKTTKGNEPLCGDCHRGISEHIPWSIGETVHAFKEVWK